MNIIRELIGSVKSGSHSGKGNKFYNKGNYEKALHHYELSAKYNEQGFVGSNPALLEYLAMTYAQLGKQSEALHLRNKPSTYFVS
jgi:tetratricopeptide (TPR) repeat protein